MTTGISGTASKRVINPELLEAAKSNNTERLITLLRDAEVNVVDCQKMTPLHYAAQLGNIKAFQALLEAGADPSIKDNYYNAPIYFANCRGHKDILEILSEKESNNCVNEASLQIKNRNAFCSIL